MKLSAVLFALALVMACKGKPKHNAPPETGSAAHGARAAPDIALPHSDGSAIAKTTAKIDEATLHKLQAMTFQGFSQVGHGFNASYGFMEVEQRTPDHPTIWAVITIDSCTDDKTALACLPMDAAQWKVEPRISELKKLLPPDLARQSDTAFEVGDTVVDQTKMVFTYQLGQSSSKPSTPEAPGSAFNPGGFSFTHAYFLYYNDGVNQIRVVAEYKDDPMPTKEKMTERVPRADLENVAKAFMDVYTHAW